MWSSGDPNVRQHLHQSTEYKAGKLSMDWQEVQLVPRSHEVGNLLLKQLLDGCHLSNEQVLDKVRFVYVECLQKIEKCFSHGVLKCLYLACQNL